MFIFRLIQTNQGKKTTKADKKRKKGVNESPTKKQPKHKKRIIIVESVVKLIITQGFI